MTSFSELVGSCGFFQISSKKDHPRRNDNLEKFIVNIGILFGIELKIS